MAQIGDLRTVLVPVSPVAAEKSLGFFFLGRDNGAVAVFTAIGAYPMGQYRLTAVRTVVDLDGRGVLVAAPFTLFAAGSSSLRNGHDFTCAANFKSSSRLRGKRLAHPKGRTQIRKDNAGAKLLTRRVAICYRGTVFSSTRASGGKRSTNPGGN